jgi:hypothetical protein
MEDVVGSIRRFRRLSDAIVVIFRHRCLAFPSMPLVRSLLRGHPERRDTSASASGSGVGLYGGFGTRGVGTR